MSDTHERIRSWWDADASAYDASAGHAMADPVEAAAWAAALRRFLPAPPARVLDIGAGTGALSLLAAELGYEVTALDLSAQMLAKAREKAGARGYKVTFVHARADEPPGGPFDAVMERHVTWTLPDPTAAMRAWRDVVRPGGHLVLFEGSWGGEGPFVAATDAAARALGRLYRVPDDHHAPYPDDLIGSLPLARTTSPAPFVGAMRDAGWQAVRLQRLRDVEWAIARREPWPLGRLTHRPRYALVADA